MCNCLNHRRLWEETQDGKYPASDHAPSCEDFKTERFVRVGYDGTWCVMEPGEAFQMIEDSEQPEDYEVEYISLTRDQFEKLADFTGF